MYNHCHEGFTSLTLAHVSQVTAYVSPAATCVLLAATCVSLAAYSVTIAANSVSLAFEVLLRNVVQIFHQSLEVRHFRRQLLSAKGFL